MYELYFQTMRQNNFKNILHIQNQKYNLTNVINCICYKRNIYSFSFKKKRYAHENQLITINMYELNFLNNETI